MTPDVLDERDFPTVDEAAWRALAERALRGVAFEEALVSTSEDGFRYSPIAGRAVDGAAVARGGERDRWVLSQRIDDPDPARALEQLETDIANGADGITLCMEGSHAAYGFGVPTANLADLIQAAAEIRSLRIEAPSAALFGIVDQMQRLDLSDNLSVSLGLRIDGSDMGAGDTMDRTLEKMLSFPPRGTIFAADGRQAHNAGASAAQELGFALASAVETIRATADRFKTLAACLEAIEFVIATDQDQFMSIARLRAFRQLHARLVELLDLEPSPARIHAETSLRMLSPRDPETNILRNTIAVFAAGIGGADSVSVLPHTLANGLPDRFARRLARNTQTILLAECHLGHVLDPAAGAGAIEDITQALCERAWAEFQTIEREGGLRQSIQSGAVLERITSKRSERREALRRGDRPVVGATVYPLKAERPINVLVERGRSPATPLSPAWLARELEGDAA
jgi:methylmalonyl-CoA mutase